MSTEPGNTGNTSAPNRGSADGGPLRDRSDRPAANDSAAAVPIGSARTDDAATQVIGTGSASAAEPGRGSEHHTGSHVADPVGGYAQDTPTRAVPAAAEDTPTRAVPATDPNDTRTGALPADHDTLAAPAIDAEDTRTRALPADHDTPAAPATASEDTRTRVAPVTASRDLPDETDRHHRGTESEGVVDAALPNREALLAREKERFGGMKFGAAFFGWLTATGMVVLLSALAAAIGAAVGLSAETNLGAALESAAANQSAGIIGAVIMLVVLLLSYYAGGYVAGRMARFNGLKQGLAVWLWALIAAAVVVILGLIYGSDIRSIAQLNSVAPLPENLENVSAGTWIAVGASLVVTLIGAILGGLAGMRFHRRIDRADFRTEETVR